MALQPGTSALLVMALCWLTAEAAMGDVPITHVIVDGAAPRDPHCKAVRDINGDAFPDIAVASADGQGLVWYAYPLWTRKQIAPGTFTVDMQLADLDGDLDADVVTYDWDAHAVVWFENPRPDNDPAVDPWQRHVIGSISSAHDVEVTDIDRDQKVDVVTRQQGGGGTSVWYQVTKDSWIEMTVDRDPGEGTVLGDVDLDGDRDIVHNGFWVETPLDPRHSSTPWPHHTIDDSWPEDVGVHLANLDGDLQLEVLLAPSESANGRLSWYDTSDPKGGAGAWTEHVIDASVSYFHTFKTADMDGDGTLDVVTAEMHQSSDPDEVSIYYNRIKIGQLENWHQQVVATSGAHNLRVADLDLDGDMDIIGCNWDSDAPNGAPVECWLNNSSDRVQPIVVLTINRDRASQGQKLIFQTACPGLPNALAALMTWSLNGGPFFHLLALSSLDGAGTWQLSVTVPPGLAGISVEFQAAGLSPIGVDASNRKIISFQ